MPNRFFSIPTLIAIFIIAGCLAFTGITRPPGGEQLYRIHCAKCHGADGSKGKAGKNKLQESNLGREAIAQQIENGKKGMPSFKKKLTIDDISAVTDYVLTLRK